ncbi:MtrAB system histidine kinase MtrB [Actinotalea sp.]|uniref:MtrAB system histidine kinase MtrB n=1 Tax=Actinotalea sp. TaxID=1872145 RepID=UPI002BA194E2|nr:MtrAB system histidine kinase MtrB [Actinotalea sp.]HQY34393.1 MtrAB system histidine kinase MtrB [Actinotalea sp.]HRA49997.1 MtrAB system histidine kinase MtrB [Actinotalea sp.]
MSGWWTRVRRRALLARWRAVQGGRAAVYHWRASLQVRVITSTLVVGIAALVTLGGYLSDRIRDGLFEQRVQQLLEESARSTQGAQENLSASSVPTEAEVQALFYALVRALKASGSGEPEVWLRRSPGDVPVLVNDVSTADRSLDVLLTPELRETVRSDDLQRWTSVAIPTEDGGAEPGVVIGSVVNVPAAGQYELYYLYSLQAEQTTLSFVQQVLALAGAGLVVLLGAMTWLVTRQAVQPVRSAAGVAERLADGHLTERMTVKGVDEMATLARSFNEMAESLEDQIGRMEEMSHLQRRFVSDVSHELRTPLTTIRMAAEVIHEARGGLDPAAARSAELLTAQLDRFEDLLADLLEISRFDAGAAMLDAQGRDVRDVVTGAVEQAAPLAERRGVWLSVDLPEVSVIADIDPRRIERVLRNLLVNAVEHAEGRPVEVRLGADQRTLAVTVRDHGVGMTEEEAEHVFDRFWRADPARARTTGGTGLGLAISIEDAHLHGGWLEAWGRPGQGACFRLTLPRRAGIALESSPLALVPVEDDVPVLAATLGSGLDPAGLPDLDRLED